MEIDHTAFFDGFRRTYGLMNQSTVSGIELIGHHMERDPNLRNVHWAAYMLATVKHECANTWQPIVEYGSESYFGKYEFDQPLGQRLGNLRKGDGYKYRGRGYVQITGLANYRRMSLVLGLPGVDLVKDPAQALRPQIAYAIMSVGMRQGLFTGKKLSDYFNGGTPDFLNARRIINGVDQAQVIADYAVEFDRILLGALDRPRTQELTV